MFLFVGVFWPNCFLVPPLLPAQLVLANRKFVAKGFIESSDQPRRLFAAFLLLLRLHSDSAWVAWSIQEVLVQTAKAIHELPTGPIIKQGLDVKKVRQNVPFRQFNYGDKCKIVLQGFEANPWLLAQPDLNSQCRNAECPKSRVWWCAPTWSLAPRITFWFLRVFSLLKQPAHRNVQAVLCSFTVFAGVLLPAN